MTCSHRPAPHVPASRDARPERPREHPASSHTRPERPLPGADTGDCGIGGSLAAAARRHPIAALVLGLAALLLPWLGLTLFSSKGEPREAIVAMSMLQSGDWVLPVSYGADIPYKPPLLAWLIAVASLALGGGHVSEFTSRLPSALALIAMAAGLYRWLAPRQGRRAAMVAALVLATSFEVFRSAVICRVDMLLTACMVLALLGMHSWRQCPRAWKAAAVILLLSGAVLTKGPVGALLPCAAMGLYCVIKGDNILRAAAILLAACVASMLIPAAWYAAAYARGGDEFLSLAWEENIGRLTGTMGYDSHVNPWTYNLLTLLYGMLPWTLAALTAAWVLRRSRPLTTERRMLGVSARWPRVGDTGTFALVCAAAVFVFYCIPASKRSVYLLPMYPFMAIGVATLLEAARASGPLRVSAAVCRWIAGLAPLCVIAARWVPSLSCALGAMHWWQYPLALVATAVAAVCARRREGAVTSLLACTLALYFSYLSAIQPMVLNPKSDRPAADAVAMALDSGVPVYTLTADSLMRYYTLNYYLGDRLRRLPADGSASRPCAVIAERGQEARARAMLRSVPADSAELLRRSCDNRRGAIIFMYK